MGKTHRFQIGDINCIALEEGTVGFDPSTISSRYPNASEEEIQDAISTLKASGAKLENYFNTLYIEAGDTKILVDAGMGYNPERPDIGKTLAALASEGINPEDIDIVYITHFHGDHYMGLLSNGEATFPNARYVTLDDEWNFWLSDDAREKMAERVQGILNVVTPLEDKFSTLSAGDELAPGVHVMAIPGHTMGQSALRIESGGDTLIHLVDLLHSTAQFRYPDWHFVYDTDGELAVRSRREQLGNALNHNLLVMFYHLPFPGLGHVAQDGQNYKWIPV